MNSGKIVAGGWTGRDGTGEIEGSTRGPRGPKNDIFVYLYLKVGHMVTGLFSGKRPTSRGEYDSYTLRWGVS